MQASVCDFTCATRSNVFSSFEFYIDSIDLETQTKNFSQSHDSAKSMTNKIGH